MATGIHAAGRVPGLHAVIMAGGSGTRFWPMSRKRLPKQFLGLTGGRSLIAETHERLVPIVGPERIWVVAGEAHLPLVRRELPQLPPENVLGEPAPRNTAPCIGLVASRIARHEPDAKLLVCPSDHIVRPAEAFAEAAAAAARLLDEVPAAGGPWTITFGIVPRFPATGFGYIQQGEPISSKGAPAFRVARFQEKPHVDVARGYVASGRFLWNSGIFLWTASGVLQLIDEHLPVLAGGLREITRLADAQGSLEAALRSGFGALPSISIDHGVLEKARNVAVLPASFEWDDVGSWRAVERYGARDGAGNSVLGRHVSVDTRNCIIVGKSRPIATIGVSDLVVVETDDAVLICAKDGTERVKEIVDMLKGADLEHLA